MSQGSSYRQILRSSSIIGGASVINILVGLLRMKVVAVVLGPAGVGLIGLLQQLMSTASTIAGMGMSSAGTRQIAEAASTDQQVAVDAARRALLWATLILALAGGLLLWVFRELLAVLVFDDPTKAYMVGWLAVGVALSVAAGSQVALLNGMRRIGDLARISVFSALLSSSAGIPAIMLWGEQGVLLIVLAIPLASFILGHVYVARLPKSSSTGIPLADLKAQWGMLFRLGSTFMVAGIAVVVGQLVVRAMVQKDLGADDLGYFTAAWTISMTYIGFVLGAMGTDYYPRLTAVIHDHEAANRLVNEQTEVALLLAGPVFLAMMALAPWVIELLYSEAFAPAAEVLRWQILGDVLKIVSWPLGFVILAAAAGRTFMITEIFAVVAFVTMTWLTLPLMGIVATGIAFVVMYGLYLPLVYGLAQQRTGFRWTRMVKIQITLVFIAAVAIAITARRSELAAAVAGVLMAAALSAWALIRLTSIGCSVGRLAPLVRLGDRLKIWILKKTS